MILGIFGAGVAVLSSGTAQRLTFLLDTPSIECWGNWLCIPCMTFILMSSPIKVPSFAVFTCSLLGLEEIWVFFFCSLAWDSDVSSGFIFLVLLFLNQQQMRQLRATHDATEHNDKARMIVDLSLLATGKTAKVLDRAVKLVPGGEVTVKTNRQFDPELKTANLEKIT